jgi:predicted Rossmann-fold nucleotide-binding protein
MGGVNKGCDNGKGQVRGIIHEKFCVDFGEHPHIKDLVMSKGQDLSERKQALIDHGDCLLVMPGGVGTFDEFWDCVCGKSLGMKGMNKKPICLVNLNGFYDGFLMQMRRAHKEGILYGQIETYFHVESDPIAALDWCYNTFVQGDTLKATETLMDNIKENNVEEGSGRVVERKSPRSVTEMVEEVEKTAVKVEEYIKDTAPDYSNGLFLGIGLGVAATLLAQTDFVKKLFSQ